MSAGLLRLTMDSGEVKIDAPMNKLLLIVSCRAGMQNIYAKRGLLVYRRKYEQ